MSGAPTNPSNVWTRPPGPKKIWGTVEGAKKDKDGKSIKFTIQEIPEDRYEDAVAHMSKYFIAEEPLCNSLNGIDNPDYVSDFAIIWAEVLKQGISIGAFVENPGGGKAEIAGLNILGIDLKENQTDLEKFEFKSANAKKVMRIVIAITKELNVFDVYGVDKYMYALGLSVKPSYQGQSLGGHLLRAREKIGVAYQIPVTSTSFTSPISQKLASRCGFDDLLVRDYDQMREQDGKIAFPNIKVKTFKIMARRLY